jgi:hypothetical protein
VYAVLALECLRRVGPNVDFFHTVENRSGRWPLKGILQGNISYANQLRVQPMSQDLHPMAGLKGETCYHLFQIYHLSSPTIAFSNHNLSHNPLQEPPRNWRYPSVVRPGPFRFVPHARDSSRRRRRTDSSCRRWTVGRRREDFDVLSRRPPRGPSFLAAGVLRFGGFSACISIHLVCSDWYENEQLLRPYKCMYLYLGHEYFRTRNCLVN